MQMLSATHPPLAKRIRRIDPQWDGKFDRSDQPAAAPDQSRAVAPEGMPRHAGAKQLAAVAAGVTVADAMTSIDQIGNPTQETVDYARSLLTELPLAIGEAAREPYGARAIIYSMVLNKGQDVLARQLNRLQAHADPDVYALTLKLMSQTDDLDFKFRLPIIDIAIPALKQLSPGQYKSFKANVAALVEMDARVDLLEWSLQKILFGHLDGQFLKLTPTRVRHVQLESLKKEIELVLSMLAYAGAEDESATKEAFAAAVQVLGAGKLALLAKDRIRIADLDLALERLEKLRPLSKARLLKACVAGIGRDQKVTAVEMELFRAFAGVLECPVSPGIV